jgi:hypothetical protein
LRRVTPSHAMTESPATIAAMNTRPLFLLELNEFSASLMEAAAQQGDLPNVRRALTLKRSLMLTDDEYDSGFLEPWSQWVSVHSGHPASEHRIQHLGDVPGLAFPQIWEELGKQGISTGIWGVMNGAREGAPGCAYFLPDPWTFSEEAYPAELGDLLALPRYLATNYVEISKAQVLRLAGKFIVRLGREVGWGTLVGSLRMLVGGLATYGPHHFVFIVWFEYLSALAMLSRATRNPSQFRILFINSIAHLQHHYWTDGAGTVTPQIAFGYRMVDQVLGRVFRLVGDGALIITNALTQTNTNEDPPWILYRPRDHAKMIAAFGIAYEGVEPLMTYDAHVFFADVASADIGEKVLREATVRGIPLFQVDRTSDTKLFFRIDFFDEVSDTEQIAVNRQRLNFSDLFVRIVRRTGKHGNQGTAFSSGIDIPSRLMNHELYGVMVRHFATPAEGHMPQAVR